MGQGKRRHSFVAQQDVAAFAVVALQDRRAQGQTFVIGGPQPVSWLDVIAAFERELGQVLPVQTVAPGEPVSGLPDFVGQLLATLEAYGSPIDMSELAATYNVALTSHDEFVRGFVHAAARTPSWMSLFRDPQTALRVDARARVRRVLLSDHDSARRSNRAG